MMSFEFTRLISKYSVPITITRETVSTSGPRKSTTTEQYTTSQCAVFDPKPAEIEHYEALQYVSNAIKIYQPENLTVIRQSDDSEISFQLKENDKIDYNSDTYEVLDVSDRTTHSDFIMVMASKEVVE